MKSHPDAQSGAQKEKVSGETQTYGKPTRKGMQAWQTAPTQSSTSLLQVHFDLCSGHKAVVVLNICCCVVVLHASNVLLSAAYQWRKNVIIAIDVGNSLSATQLRMTKAVAKHIIFSLGDSDWVRC